MADRLDLLLPKLAASMMNMWKSAESEAITVDELRIDWTAAPDETAVVENYTEACQAAEADMARGILAAFGA